MTAKERAEEELCTLSKNIEGLQKMKNSSKWSMFNTDEQYDLNTQLDAMLVYQRSLKHRLANWRGVFGEETAAEEKTTEKTGSKIESVIGCLYDRLTDIIRDAGDDGILSVLTKLL